MKSFVFSLFMIFIITNHSEAQKRRIEDFYGYLNEVLEDKNIESVHLFQTHYECLGNKSYWDAVLLKKSNKIEIKFYNHVPKDLQHLNVLTKRLDTTFIVSKNKLIKNLKNEPNHSNSNRRIIFEGSYKLVIKTNDKETEYLVTKAEGLIYLLRYNKVYETYMDERIKKREKTTEN